MNNFGKSCILMFVKSPELGGVKTRLSQDLGDGIALSLYKNFVLDLLETLGKGGLVSRIFFYPPEAGEKVSNWLGKEYAYRPQKGNDLGDRMKAAFIETFSEGFSKVHLIGSDIPDLTYNVMTDAFEFNNHDAVIGPAVDGGYYLIGFKDHAFLPQIFEGIEWGTDKVFGRTMEIFTKHNSKVKVLPEWRDVDKIEDLKALFERNRGRVFSRSRTMAFISDNLEKLFPPFT